MFSRNIPARNRISLGEGGNALLELKHHDYKRLYILREDDNPSGSHKDRYMAYLLSALEDSSPRGYVISSSGNAGISLAKYSRHLNRPCIICLKPETSGAVIDKILSLGGNPLLTDKPINYSNIISRVTGYANIRAGLNPLSCEGYRTIPAELLEKGNIFDSLFMFSTSFSTVSGILDGYEQLRQRFETAVPRIFAVISGDFHPFSGEITRGPEEIAEGIHRINTSDNVECLIIGSINRGLWNNEKKIGGFCSKERFRQVYSKLRKNNGCLVYAKDVNDPQADAFFRYYRISTSCHSACSIFSAYMLQKSGIVHAPLAIQSGSPPSDRQMVMFSEFYIKSLKELLNYLDKNHAER